MRYSGTLAIPGLGLSWHVEVELSPEDSPAAEPATLTDAELCARWHRTPRTTRRLRDQRRLPFLQPSPRTILYRIDDVRAYETANYRGPLRRAVRRTA